MKQLWSVVGLIVTIYILNTRSIPIDSNCEGSSCCGTGFQPCLIVAKRQVEADPSASALQGSTDENGNLVNNSPPIQDDGSNQQISQETVSDPSQGTLSSMNGDPLAQGDNSMNPTNPIESSQNNDAASQSSEIPADSAQPNNVAATSSTGNGEASMESAPNNDAASASPGNEVPAESTPSTDSAAVSQNTEVSTESTQPSDSATASQNMEASTQISDSGITSQNMEAPTQASDPGTMAQSNETPLDSTQTSPDASQGSEASVGSTQPSDSATTSQSMEAQSSKPASATQSNEIPVDSNTSVNSEPNNSLPATGGSEASVDSQSSNIDVAATPVESTPSSETVPISGSSEATGTNQELEVSTSQPSDTTPESNSETPAVPPLTVSGSNQASADSSQNSDGIVSSGTTDAPAVPSQSSDTPGTNEAETSPSGDVAVSSQGQAEQTTDAATVSTPQTSEASAESISSNSDIMSESQSQSSSSSEESNVPQSSESPVEPLKTTEAPPQRIEGSTDSEQANNNEVTESGNAAATPVDSTTSNNIVPALTGEGQSGSITANSTSTQSESQTGETSVEPGQSSEISSSVPSQTPEATAETEESQAVNIAQSPNAATAVENETSSTPTSDTDVRETTTTETPKIEDKTLSLSEVTEIPFVSSSPNTIGEQASTSDATTHESLSTATEPSSSTTLSTSTPETKPLSVTNSSFDVVTNTRHHFESYDDLVVKLNQTFEKSYIEITQALSELLKNETVFNSSTAIESTTLTPTTPTTGRPTVTPKPVIIVAQNRSDGETLLYPDSVDTTLSDLGAPGYSSQEPLEPEDESLFGTTPSPKYNSDVFLRGETSPGCLMEDRESFKRNAYATVYSMTDGKPTMLSFLERETCVGTLSKTGRRTVRSRGILLPQLPLKLKIEAGMYIQNRLYLFDSSPAQKVWSFTYENSTRIYSLKSHSVISIDAFLQVCDILSQPPNFRIKAIAQFSLTDPTCIVYDKTGTPLLSANASEEAVSLVNAIRYLMEREFISQINSIFSWLDDPFVKSVYLYGSNGELYELYRDATSHNLWPMGKYRLIPYEDFPIPNKMVSGNF